MIKRLTIILISFTFLFNYLLAQEYTELTSINTEIKKYLKENPQASQKNNKSKSIKQLPFWDDFSYDGVYADPNLWEIYDRVYINSTFAVEPPSIGFATFDAINANGEIYDIADYETSFIADILTSDSINLDYPGDNTIYLSFYYKPQGIGDAPDLNDSLILEFYAPEEESWNTVWFSEGSENSDFKFEIIHINEDKYLKTGFKFRFKNYASLGADTYPDQAANCDFWHIDYIYLNKDRTAVDSVFKDIAFNKPLHSLLKDYESIPWNHYKSLSTSIIKDEISIAYKNNDSQTRLIDSLNFVLSDESGLSLDQEWFAGVFFPPGFKQEFYDFTGHNFNFPENSNNFADFKLTAKIVTNTDDSAQNNSISYIQKFRDHYAYDDGSAEAGYGIYGTGTKYGSVAYRFDPVKTDDLIGVKMYFTRTLNDASQKYFWISIWEVDQNGQPGDTIRTFEGLRPEYENELNKFHYYEFNQVINLDRPFFIGWTQTTEDKLNIGFDYNNIATEKVFYNKSGEWTQSEVLGAVMIRPVFGKLYSSILSQEIKPIKVYPNPANQYIHIDFEKNYEKNYTLYIYDIQGRQVFTKSDYNSESISISHLPSGLYLIRISDNNSKFFNSKFLKQ